MKSEPATTSQKATLSRAVGLLRASMDRSSAWCLIATNLAAVAGGLLSGLAPLSLKGLVDAVDAVDAPSDARTASSVLWFSIAYLLCLALCRGLGELRPALTSAAEQRLYGRMRAHFFRHALHLPLSFHVEERAGAVTHALQQGIAGYQIIMYSLVNSLVPVLVEAVTVALVLFSLRQPLLTTIFGVSAILYVFIGLRRSRSLAAAATNVSSAGSDASSHLAEALTNVEPIKCFGMEARWVDDFIKATSALEVRWSDLHRQRLLSGLSVLVVFTISMCGSLAAAIHGLREGALTLGGFMMAIMYMAQVLRPLDMLVAGARDVTQGLAFMAPMLKILALRPEDPGDAGRVANATRPARAALTPVASLRTADHIAKPPRIQFEGIRLSFANRAAVFEDLHLDIPAGRSIAIVGASGCGKSTLARLLLRFWVPQGGRILWDGQSIETLDLDTLRARIAVVPQDTALFNRSVAENIAIAKPGASPAAIERAARLAQLHDFVTCLPRGYETVIGERGLKISGGERQRIAIARAILRDPLVYIFDEATSMLDSATEQAIIDDMREVFIGRTTIVIAHRLSVLREVDSIAVLSGGRIVEQGSHDTLLASGGVYATMWKVQQASHIE